MAMASLGAGQGDESFLPCGKHGLCLRARIVRLGACRRAAAGERGRWLSWSSQRASLGGNLPALAQGVPGHYDSYLVLSP